MLREAAHQGHMKAQMCCVGMCMDFVGARRETNASASCMTKGLRNKGMTPFEDIQPKLKMGEDMFHSANRGGVHHRPVRPIRYAALTPVCCRQAQHPAKQPA